ncbi:hypothetical protein B9K06_02315 [Bacillus sp. OG2]|nr:hypothetical protein B9K06_02315 [Bacillus sp. OG2]
MTNFAISFFHSAIFLNSLKLYLNKVMDIKTLASPAAPSFQRKINRAAAGKNTESMYTLENWQTVYTVSLTLFKGIVIIFT